MNPSMGKQIFRGAAIIGLFALLGKLLGIVQKVVIAHQFGTGMEADAFVLAFSSIVFAFFMIPQQMLAAFLPLFSEAKTKEGEERAWGFASSVAVIVALCMIVIVLACLFMAPSLVALVSSFKSEDARILTTDLTRIMLPAALFMGLFYLACLLLNAYKRFAMPALGDVLNKTALIGTLVILSGTLGIRSLAFGVVAGAGLGLALQVVALRRYVKFMRFRPVFRDPLLRQFGRLLPPIAVSILVAQTRTILDYKFASGMGEGCASSLNYARGLADTLIFLVPSAVGVAIYPYLSDLTASDQRQRLSETLIASLRILAMIFVPVSVLLITLHTPIVQLMFQRGKFTDWSVDMTAGPLMYYSFGLTFFALEIILMRVYFSFKDTLTPALIGIFCVLVHVGVILSLRCILQHQSIALAAVVSKGLKVVILLALLSLKRLNLQPGKNLLFVAKLLVSAIISGFVVSAMHGTLASILPLADAARGLARTAYLVIHLGAACGAGILAFLLASLVLGIEESRLVMSRLRLRKQHGTPGQGC